MDIDINELWIFNDTTDDVSNRPEPNNLPFILRFILFCDQSHDFCENASRNKWSPAGDGSAAAISFVFNNILKTKYEKDIEWILAQYQAKGVDPQYFETLIKQHLVITESEAKNTSLLTDKIDNILFHYLNIRAIGGYDVLLTEQQKRKSAICSGSSSILLQVLNILSTAKNKNQFNITVDADKSKINLGSLLLYLCDRVASVPTTEINFFNTIATKYDAASGSGTSAYLEKVTKSLNTITENGSTGKYNNLEAIAPCNVIIHYKGLQLLNFTYDLQNTAESDQNMTILCTLIGECISTIEQKKISSDVDQVLSSSEFFVIVTQYINKINQSGTFQKGLTLTKINQLRFKLVELLKQLQDQNLVQIPPVNSNESFVKTSISFPFDLKTESISVSKIVDKPHGISAFQSVFNKVCTKAGIPLIEYDKKDVLFYFLIVQIIKYFQNQYTAALHQVMEEAKRDQILAALRIDKFFSYDRQENFPGVINETQCSVSSITGTLCDVGCLTMNPDLPYVLILYKTLSDFGAVAVFYYTVINNIGGLWNEGTNIFISFDRICCRIACLFIPKTIFENLATDVAVAPITVFVNKNQYESTSSAAGGLLKLNPTQFGKRNKTKKTKIKHSDKIIKLAKKYHINLDKNTIKNLKNLYNVQKSAKKLNIKITKKTSSGKKIYKTEKELIKNIKEFNQSHNNRTLQKVKLLREKAKKHNIRLTKKTSKGKRIYKTNKELEKELKKFRK